MLTWPLSVFTFHAWWGVAILRLTCYRYLTVDNLLCLDINHIYRSQLKERGLIKYVMAAWVISCQRSTSPRPFILVRDPLNEADEVHIVEIIIINPKTLLSANISRSPSRRKKIIGLYVPHSTVNTSLGFDILGFVRGIPWVARALLSHYSELSLNIVSLINMLGASRTPTEFPCTKLWRECFISQHANSRSRWRSGGCNAEAIIGDKILNLRSNWSLVLILPRRWRAPALVSFPPVSHRPLSERVILWVGRLPDHLTLMHC